MSSSEGNHQVEAGSDDSNDAANQVQPRQEQTDAEPAEGRRQPTVSSSASGQAQSDISSTSPEDDQPNSSENDSSSSSGATSSQQGPQQQGPQHQGLQQEAVNTTTQAQAPSIQQQEPSQNLIRPPLPQPRQPMIPPPPPGYAVLSLLPPPFLLVPQSLQGVNLPGQIQPSQQLFLQQHGNNQPPLFNRPQVPTSGVPTPPGSSIISNQQNPAGVPAVPAAGAGAAQQATAVTSNAPEQVAALTSAVAARATQSVAITVPHASLSSTTPTDEQATLLSLNLDEEYLSDYQCLVRKQIELFVATQKSIHESAQGRNRPICLGQVGIRCRHCGSLPPSNRVKGAVYFPSRLLGLYQTAQNMANAHLVKDCNEIPSELRRKLLELREQCNYKSSHGGGRRYWAQGLRAMGVVESADRRLRIERDDTYIK